MKTLLLSFGFLIASTSLVHANTIREVTNMDDYNQYVVNAGHPVLVELYASWCHICQQVDRDRVLYQVAQNIDVVRVEASSLGSVTAFPEFHLYSGNGDSNVKKVGYNSPSDLVNWVNNNTSH
jgi:thiol-disulfide isomerase/thioredoxin